MADADTYEPSPKDPEPGADRLPVDLAPDEITLALQRDGVPEDLVTLCGFLGTSEAAGRHRLFTDPSLKSWVDVRDEDIMHRRRVPGEHETFGERSVLWVRRDAPLVKGEVTEASAEADFLCGSWSDEIPWQPCDEALDQGPQRNLAYGGGSRYQTPPGVRCC